MHGLMDHVKLLIVLGNLLVGAAMAMYLHQTHRRYGLASLKPIFFHIVFYNLLVLTLFVGKYYELNLGGKAPVLPPALKNTLLMMLIYIFLMGFSYASLGIYLTFMEKKISRTLRRFVGFGSLLLLGGIPIELLLPQGGIWRLVHYNFYENVGIVFVALELGLMIALPLRARKLLDGERARVVRAFSFLYISRYPVIAALMILPQPFRLLFALLYPNIVPYLWLRFFMLPHAEKAVSRDAIKADIGGIERRYGLSPREKEILGLILAGKSNRDMEEELFISYHTVKNHVYNIYRKLGVKTRFELLHLASRSSEGDGRESESAP